MPVSWVIVVALGAIPPAVLGLVSHLAVLRRHIDPAVLDEGMQAVPVVPPAGPRPSQGRPKDGPRYASEDAPTRKQ